MLLYEYIIYSYMTCFNCKAPNKNKIKNDARKLNKVYTPN